MVEVERVLSEKDKPTDYFPSYNLIYVGKAVNSQFMQDSPGATQVINVGLDKYAVLGDLLEKIKSSIDELSLESEAKAELKAEVMTVEAQLSSPKPKPKVINECIGTVRRILEGAAGSVLAQNLLSQIMALL